MGEDNLPVGEDFAWLGGTETGEGVALRIPPCLDGERRTLSLPKFNCLLHIALFCKHYQKPSGRRQRNGCASRCLQNSDFTRRAVLSYGMAAVIRMHYVGIKNARALKAERLTCALTSGLPLFCKQWQRYAKIPKPPKDFGIFLQNNFLVRNFMLVKFLE